MHGMFDVAACKLWSKAFGEDFEPRTNSEGVFTIKRQYDWNLRLQFAVQYVSKYKICLHSCSLIFLASLYLILYAYVKYCEVFNFSLRP